MLFDIIDFNRITKYTTQDILVFLHDIEQKIAIQNNRNIAQIKINPSVKFPEYDVDNHIIELPDAVTNTNFVKSVIAIYHESEHANQSLSAIKTKDEKTLFDISMALYQDDGIQYSCNYREIIARLFEAKKLVEFYNIALKQTVILSKKLSRDFENTIDTTIQFLDEINSKNIRNLQKWNIKNIKQDKYKIKYVQDLPKDEILKFLRKTAPKMYKHATKEVKQIEKELKQIKNILYHQYHIETSETTEKLAKINEAKIQQQHDKTDKMQSNNMIAYIHSIPEGHYEENTFDYFDDFKEFIEKTIDSGQVDKVYVDIDWNNEIFKTYIQHKGEKTFADEVLDNNYIPEITTNHDEVDISK